MQLEWTLRHPSRPGLTLRRRVPLFDELGRVRPPEFPVVHLLEDVDTLHLPPASAAAGGVLDV